MTDWKTWPKCGVFFLSFFFFFCFFFVCFVFPEQQTCQIWVGHSSEIWNLILDEQDTRQNRVEEVCCSKCFIVSVISFLVYFDKQVHKKKKKKKTGEKTEEKKLSKHKKKKKKKKKKKTLETQLWDIGFISSVECKRVASALWWFFRRSVFLF